MGEGEGRRGISGCKSCTEHGSCGGFVSIFFSLPEGFDCSVVLIASPFPFWPLRQRRHSVFCAICIRKGFPCFSRANFMASELPIHIPSISVMWSQKHPRGNALKR